MTFHQPAIRFLLTAAFATLIAQIPTHAQTPQSDACPRPTAGTAVPEPENLRAQDGTLKLDLSFRRVTNAQGHILYCYADDNGAESPTLRLNPGDTLILNLKNDIADPAHAPAMKMNMGNSCANGKMSPTATNLHFHGLMISPTCHEDDVLHTVIDPQSPAFEYRFQIPKDQPPGLYWYHPHIHGFTKDQVIGGASGALIIEGIERINNQLAGLPERVFVIRDQDLLNPDAAATSDSAPHPVELRDAEGDILNTGTDGGKPNKDLSVNFVPVPYPDYRPATIEMKPAERQFWRVVNASGITYIDLEVLFNGTQQPLGVVALDGVPIDDNGQGGHGILWKSHILLPPAGRAEFIFNGPPAGVQASLATRGVDTGPVGENDPTRTLATILTAPDAPEPQSVLPTVSAPHAETSAHHSARHIVALQNIVPIRTRKLYFSEKPQDPNDPNSPTEFYITVDGHTPAVFDPSATAPNITVHQGDVEDWIIENRSRELHAFHIHQIHFMMLEFNGVPIDEPFLRDTINVAYWDAKSLSYPSVKLRMDFRDKNIVGTFLYHCHLLEHEDGGMMGTIRVLPRAQTKLQK